MESFVESGMTFGPYEDGACFRLETSETYRAIQDRVKIAELWLLRTDTADSKTIWIVEAKQSSPRPELHERFAGFIDDIRDKMTNSLALGVAAILRRHVTAEAELPVQFKTLDFASTGFRLILVINGHDKSWLAPLQETLRQKLRTLVQIWNLGANSVVVLNHELALKHGLISAC